MNLRTHKYRGREIRPASEIVKDGQNNPYRWYVTSTHAPTGLPYDESNCSHTYTLAHARRCIDDALEAVAIREEDDS